MSGQPYITTPSGRRIRLGDKKNGMLLRKHPPSHTVSFVSNCEWAEASVSSVHVYDGGSVTVPLVLTMGADYTYVGAIGGTVSEAGVTVENVTSDVEVTLVPAREPYVISVESLCDWASTESESYYGFEGHTATIPVTLTDDADDSTISVTGGVLSNDAIVIADVQSDIDVTISPAKVQVNASLLDTNVITAISPTRQYVSPGDTAQITCTYASGMSASDVTVSTGTITGNTWYIPTSSANWVISASAYAAGSGYTYFKLDITAIRSGSIVQLSELGACIPVI